MTPYETQEGRRKALEARLRQHAHEAGVDVIRLRRGLAFERIAARLTAEDPGNWVVKGGMALEWRLPDHARTTRDLDLVRRDGIASGAALRDRLIEILSSDPQSDSFTFRVGPAKPLDVGFRFSVQAHLAGSEFAGVRMDVSMHPEELAATERLRLPPSPMSFLRIEPVEVEVVAPSQHFAEKLHAMTRDYGDEGSTRVHDLADLMLLIERKLVVPHGLVPVVRHLFEARATHPVPHVLPDPPESWREPYAALALPLELEARTFEAAVARLRDFWAQALKV